MVPDEKEKSDQPNRECAGQSQNGPACAMHLNEGEAQTLVTGCKRFNAIDAPTGEYDNQHAHSVHRTPARALSWQLKGYQSAQISPTCDIPHAARQEPQASVSCEQPTACHAYSSAAAVNAMMTTGSSSRDIRIAETNVQPHPGEKDCIATPNDTDSSDG